MSEKKKYQFHELYLKKEWSYQTGAVLLALFSLALVIVTGKSWGVTGPLGMWGGWILSKLGIAVDTWAGFKATPVASYDIWKDLPALTNIGIVVGALLAVLLAAQFKIKKLKSIKNLWAAILGGLLMGIGARISLGCNIGAFFTALPAFSLHGWIFWISIFSGAAVGSKLLVKYFM
ncbi:MAG TPA: YeeE/YedE thiosulfate transporter family protein [Spirochaetia bacterium]|nr:YeeE/YedE thiosulfate transporter family protein [Spirochaetales bacterium]HRS64619.1 YeeE/YedE thiosulfate transporter family protein [Spirochaetia bacterium]HOT60492.1 YeeE/YedE thiosulfate transporter family protein [Spirochaetales bacterium]HPD80861.1 YeeE/YedE thiosulfate transporter family protein [Spirochaetales bacterium]HQK34473.1 YeeE/YedE thiosulfate transporter family protein [Spirochaetales bacterium]